MDLAKLKAMFETARIDAEGFFMPEEDPARYIKYLETELKVAGDLIRTYQEIGDITRLALFKLLPNTGDNVIVDVTNFDLGATHAVIFRALDSEYGGYIDILPCDAEGNHVEVQEHVHTDACMHG